MALSVDPTAARDLAFEAVVKLRDAGFEAYWAGGCVRDQVLGMQPKDYDVATNARPEQVRNLFGRKRTQAVGAAFGVIIVRGPRNAGQLEVATFRQDQEYLDGRRPSGVVYSTAEEDAQRRDFTINGLFFDPMEDKVIDFVDGQADLQKGVVRAIGDPIARIEEDKLRMLRAVRFAARFQFRLDEVTCNAIQRCAHELAVVSQERITQELSIMLTHSNRVLAMELLAKVKVLRHLPAAPFQHHSGDFKYDQTRSIITNLGEPSFGLVMAAWLWPFEPATADAEDFCRTWRLTNEDRKLIVWLIENTAKLLNAHDTRWPTIQRLLIHPFMVDAFQFIHALAQGYGLDRQGVEFCNERLSWPKDKLNPKPLLNGADLIEMGIPSGPEFKRVLDLVRDQQLEQRISTNAEAVELAGKELSR